MIKFGFLKCYLCKDRDWFWETEESPWLLSLCHQPLTSIHLHILIHLNYSLSPHALLSPCSASAPVQVVIQNWWLLSLLGCFGLPSLSSPFCPVTDRTVWSCIRPDETRHWPEWTESLCGPSAAKPSPVLPPITSLLTFLHFQSNLFCHSNSKLDGVSAQKQCCCYLWVSAHAGISFPQVPKLTAPIPFLP